MFTCILKPTWIVGRQALESFPSGEYCEDSIPADLSLLGRRRVNRLGINFIAKKALGKRTNRHVFFLEIVLCLKARVSFGSGGLKTMISMLAIVNGVPMRLKLQALLGDDRCKQLLRSTQEIGRKRPFTGKGSDPLKLVRDNANLALLQSRNRHVRLIGKFRRPDTALTDCHSF